MSQQGVTDEGSMSYDNLIAGTQKNLVTLPATVRLSEILVRGSLVARITATGQWTEANLADVAEYDDYGIATEAVDSTGGTVLTDVFVEGDFAEGSVVFYYGDTADDWRETLAGHGIYLRPTVSVSGQ